MNDHDEDLHLDIENPKVPFATIDAWCHKSLGVWACQGDGDFRTYYFKRKQDVLMFRLRWM